MKRQRFLNRSVAMDSRKRSTECEDLTARKTDPIPRPIPGRRVTGQPAAALRPTPRNGGPVNSPIGALAEAIEAKILDVEMQGFSVRGTTLLDTKNNLEQLRREHPELFGFGASRPAAKSR
jgi:hypothetical protein